MAQGRARAQIAFFAHARETAASISSSLRWIAEDLNAAGVPTVQDGAQWYAATVRNVLLRTT